MTFDDLDTWRVTYSQFVGQSGISFALNNDPEAQGICTLRIITNAMSHGNGPMALVTWRYLELRATVYGS